MNDYKADITLNEKDSLQDLLNLEKSMVKVYGTALTEGCSKGFRTAVKQNLERQAQDQADVFFLMTELGYAEVTTAPKEDLQTQKQKFSKIKSQLN